MQPKTTDPIAPLRAIDASQAGAKPYQRQDGKEAPEKQPEPKERVIDPKAESVKWSNRYEIAKTYQLPMFEKWGKWYDDMYAHINTTQMAAWRSKVYMPIIASKVWDLISRFIQYRPGWDVAVRTLPVNTLSKEAFDAYMTEMNARVEKVKMKLDYDYDNPLNEDPIQDELLGVMLDAAVTGQGIGRVPYLNKTTDYKQYVKGDTGTDYQKVKTDTATEGYNAFQGVNIFNFFIKPGAKSLQKSPWIIVSEQVPLFELKKNPKYDQTVLATVQGQALTNEFAQYEASRNRLVNVADTSNLDTTTQMVQRYECWDKEFNECVEYVLGKDGWVEIFRGTNVYWHKKYPLVSFYIRRKPYQFWGESLFENSETLQAAINDIFNHFMDSYNMADGMIAIEEGSVVEPYVVEPGGELRYRGEMPKQFKFPQPDAAAAQTALNLITSSIENATISQYASGIANSQNDQTQGTATGVTRMMEAAAEKVGFMRSNFRRSWREVGQMWLSNSQQFMRSDVVSEKTVQGERSYEVIKPEDLMGIFGVRVDDGSFEPVSKDQKRQDFLTYVENVRGWAEASVGQYERTQDQTDLLNLDWNEIMRRGAEHFGENASLFMKPMIAMPVAGQPTDAPVEPTAPAEPALNEPLPPEELGFDTQADGKSMPDSFPIRSTSNPALGA